MCACVRFTLCWFHTFSALRYIVYHYNYWAIAVVRLRLAAAGSLWPIVYLSLLYVYTGRRWLQLEINLKRPS